MMARLLMKLSRQPRHLLLGRWGERVASKRLKKSGMNILGARVRVGKHDEIDLLAREQNILIILEVKTRSTEGMRPAKDAVDREKQIRLNRAALAYARRLTPRPEAIRFDIVEVIGTPETGIESFRHHPGAFGLHPGFRYD